MQRKIQTDDRPSRQVLDGIDKENDAVFKESGTEVNIKQFYNYKLSKDSNSLHLYKEILHSVMEQKENFDNVTYESQPFIREMTFLSAKKSSVVLFLNQTTKGWNAFAQSYHQVTTLTADDTYNIANNSCLNRI